MPGPSSRTGPSCGCKGARRSQQRRRRAEGQCPLADPPPLRCSDCVRVISEHPENLHTLGGEGRALTDRRPWDSTVLHNTPRDELRTTQYKCRLEFCSKVYVKVCFANVQQVLLNGSLLSSISKQNSKRL